MTIRDFYDALAEHYHLIFADWEASMARQGDALERLLAATLPGRAADEIAVLDVAAGIGTQALPLAARGFRVTARDLSPGAIARLRREARRRGLAIDAAMADLRHVAASVERRFEVVMALDNALPHLPTDDAIRGASVDLLRLVEPGGVLLVSVRDYDTVDRAPRSTHDYGERDEHGRRYRFRQEWEWLDATRYRTTMIGVERRDGDWHEIVRRSVVYYAVPLERLRQLLLSAGFASCHRSDDFYQPLLVARRTAD